MRAVQRIAECGVWNAGCAANPFQRGLERIADCGLRNAGCATDCGLRSVECGMCILSISTGITSDNFIAFFFLF